MIYYILAGFVSILLIHLAWKYWNFTRRYSEFPSCYFLVNLAQYYATKRIPKDLPFTGVLAQLLMSLLQRFPEGLCLVWLFEPILVCYNEETSKVLYNESGALDRPEKAFVLKDIFGEGVIMSNGSKWKKNRKFLNPVFHVGELKTKINILNDHAQILVKDLYELKDKTSVDILELINRCSLHILLESICGLKMNNQDDEALQKLITYFNESLELAVYRLIYPWLHYKFFMSLTSFGREFLIRKKEQDDFMEKILLQMKERFLTEEFKSEDSEDNNSQQRKSFAHILLERHMKDSSYTIDEIKNQIMEFIIAGYDTVSHSLLWSLFLLGNHPDVQERTINEVDTLSEGYIDYGDLCNLPYLECVVKETLRLFPAVPLIPRCTTKDIQLGKYLLPAGSCLVMMPYMLHRDPKNFSNPERFYPERFLDENLEKRPWIYTPFGEGARACIGRKFAMMEMMVILAHILRNFRVTSLDREEDLKWCYKITISPTKPIHMKFSPRK